MCVSQYGHIYEYPLSSKKYKVYSIKYVFIS